MPCSKLLKGISNSLLDSKFAASESWSEKKHIKVIGKVFEKLKLNEKQIKVALQVIAVWLKLN